MKTQLIKDVVHKSVEEALATSPHHLSPPMIMNSGVPRTGGLHLSEIIRDLYKKLNPIRFQDGGGFERMALGFAWEWVLSDAIARVFPSDRLLIHMGELECDGIKMSPDAFDVEDLCLEEWKCTWSSSNKHPDDYPYYLWQIKSYCRAIECNKARLRIYHVNGDYRERVPVVHTWLLEFSDRELEENWKFLTAHARKKGWIQ